MATNFVIGNGFGDDKAFGGDAGLAVIDDPSFNGGVGCEIEIGGRHHDEGVAAAELEDDLLNALRGGDADFHASAFTAGEGGGGHAVVAENGVDLFRADKQRLKRACREACARENFLNRKGALRDVGGMFEESDVASHEAGRDEAEDLPERKVPGHDAEDNAHGLVFHVAVFGIRRHVLIGQKAFGVFGVIAAGPGTFDRFVDGRAESLAHLSGHEAGEEFLVGFEDVGRAIHHGRPG